MFSRKLCEAFVFSDLLILYSNGLLSFFRPEDHRGRPDPVGEEALRRHDPDRVLSERVRAHRAAALHGQPAEQVYTMAPHQCFPGGA